MTHAEMAIKEKAEIIASERGSSKAWQAVEEVDQLVFIDDFGDIAELID
jgi:hypothetical protein